MTLTMKPGQGSHRATTKQAVVEIVVPVYNEAADLEASVRMLIEAAERVPNLQFLVNASKAIFTLLERKGWDPELGQRGLRYLQLAQGKDPRSPKVLSARELYRQIARKYGIDTPRPATGSRE